MGNKDELCHYGVKGMRWKHHKRYLNDNGDLNKLGKARNAYEEAKLANKIARKNRNVRGIENQIKAEEAYKKSDIDLILAKAKYAASKTKKGYKAQDKEFKTYTKELRKLILNDEDSSFDTSEYGTRSTMLYNRLKVKKGRAYADALFSKVEDNIMNEFATKTRILLGRDWEQRLESMYDDDDD